MIFAPSPAALVTTGDEPLEISFIEKTKVAFSAGLDRTHKQDVAKAREVAFDVVVMGSALGVRTGNLDG